uniref:Cysteine-rich protein 1 n=1 Tax=Timema poppense TaxID=170557 RepID=A0A7R9DU06_TIMPO|nr:unnamed protein product [Timema poppensis]
MSTRRVDAEYSQSKAERKTDNTISGQCGTKSERKTSLGKDWHSACLRCEKCNKTLTPGQHAEHEGKPYCHNPCYSALFGPGGSYTTGFTQLD